MGERLPRWVEHVHALVASAAVAFACYYVVLLLGILVRNIQLRSLIEPNEGLMLEQVMHLAAGGRLYTAPSLAWTPILYPPLYSYAALLASTVTGIDLSCLRIVSVAAVAAMLVLMYRLVRARSANAAPATAAIGFFCATYPLGDAFLGAGRVDSLTTLLLVATYAGLDGARGAGRYVFAACCGALAILCKQTASPVVGALFLASLVLAPRAALRGTLALIGLLVLGAAFLHFRESDGSWWWFYLVTLPASHPRGYDAIGTFLRGATNGAIFPALSVVLLALGVSVVRRESRSRWLLPAVFVVSTLLVGVAGDTKHAGVRNHYIPLYAALAIGLGLLGATAARAPLRRAWSALVLVQFVLLLYDPRTAAELRRVYAPGPSLLAALEKAGPDTVVLSHYGYVSAPHAHPIAHFQALDDLAVTPAGTPGRQTLLDQLQSLVHGGRVAVFIVGSWARPLLPPDFDLVYACRILDRAPETTPFGRGLGSTVICRRRDPADRSRGSATSIRSAWMTRQVRASR